LFRSITTTLEDQNRLISGFFFENWHTSASQDKLWSFDIVVSVATAIMATILRISDSCPPLIGRACPPSFWRIVLRISDFFFSVSSVALKNPLQ
jgi:hypothetical protein